MYKRQLLGWGLVAGVIAIAGMPPVSYTHLFGALVVLLLGMVLWR